MVNIYIACEINLLAFSVGKNFALGNFLFGAVKLTNNPDSNRCNILAMVLDLMHAEVFRYQMVVGTVKMR